MGEKLMSNCFSTLLAFIVFPILRQHTDGGTKDTL